MDRTAEGNATDRLVDPLVGIVLGHAWGDPAGPFLQDHPMAQLVRDDAELQEYLLPTPVEIAGSALPITLEFHLDSLVTIRLDLSQIVEDQEALERLLDEIERWFDEVDTAEEGLWVAEEAGTRMQLDLVEHHLVFQDAEAI